MQVMQVVRLYVLHQVAVTGPAARTLCFVNIRHKNGNS